MSNEIPTESNEPEPQKDFTPEELKEIPELGIVEYSTAVLQIAKDTGSKFSVPFLVPIIQSAHESRNGNSLLARQHCNLFGITATQSWIDKGGAIALMPTFEFINGKRIDVKRGFRKYGSWRESFQDWAILITTLSIYKPALQLFRNNDVAAGIAAMAKQYATDPDYAKMLTARYYAMAEVLKSWDKA